MKKVITIFLPVRPKYATAILEGRKKVEFRKTNFRRQPNKAILYSSMPCGKIVGWFEIKGVEDWEPDVAWNLYGKAGCVHKLVFFDYYKSKTLSYVIEIGEVVELNPHLPISEYKKLNRGFVVPQSFCYLSEREFETIAREKMRELECHHNKK